MYIRPQEVISQHPNLAANEDDSLLIPRTKRTVDWQEAD